MKVKKYYPNFCEVGEVHVDEVSTKDELLALEWLASWKGDPGFKGFYLAPKSGVEQRALLAVFHNGDSPSDGWTWYVVLLTHCIFKNGVRQPDDGLQEALPKWFETFDFNTHKTYKETEE